MGYKHILRLVPSMLVLPVGFLWFFFIAGVLLIAYSLFPKENRSATISFIAGFICIGTALFLWLSPSVILK
jgi:hypothetical protein